MLDAGGGGGYGGTDWNSKDVRFMWAAIANQETDPHFEVVQGWSRTADLTLAHLGQVQKYRDNLASVWPPSKSPAAAAYIERLDQLLADLRATHEAATANHQAFTTVTQTLNSARIKLKPILEQYEANEQLNLDWHAQQDALAAQSPAPLTPQFAMPPVSAARQEQLNNEARVVMYDLSNAVISGQAALKKPKPYDPAMSGAGEGGTDSDRPDGTNGFATPPFIPPPGGSNESHSSRSNYSPAANGLGAGPGSPNVHPATVVPPGAGPGAGSGVGGGPILGGIGTPPVINPPASGLPPTPVPPATSLPGAPGAIPGIVPPPLRGGAPTAGGTTPSVGRMPSGEAARPGIGGGAGSRAVMPPGGVIGTAPGGGMIGQTPTGRPASRPGAPMHANPVGGVIGQPGGAPTGRSPASRPANGAMSSTAPFSSHPGRRRDGDDRSADARQWDPDNPWATAEGVDPVLRPPAEPRPIDPGPAIGYSR